MRLRNGFWRRRRELHRLGILFVIFSLVHTPLPQPDFHNIRHHDGPGEVCDHHDHLLRWHPGAGVAEDVATLHWHWFLPTSGPDDAPVSDDRPALHAHVFDGFASTCEDAPQIVPDTESRLIARTTLLAHTTISIDLPGSLRAPDSLALGMCRSLDLGATTAPGARLTSLLHRWLC